MILFWLLRNWFWENEFRIYYEVTPSDKWQSISNCQELCLLHFLKFSSPETSFQIVYGRITKIDARIEDRKFAITFKVLICPKFHWPYSIEKCSRIRLRPVWASRSIAIIWFPSLSSLKSNFEQNLWFIQKIFLDQIHQKTCQTRYKPQISYIF